MHPFHGAKVALFLGADLLVYKRDAFPHIPFPGAWDLPGGGREPGETPQDTVIRETIEEFSLILTPQDLSWARRYPRPAGDIVWFFVSHQPAARRDEIIFGDEGQMWDIWSIDQFLSAPDAVPTLQARLKDYLDDIGGQNSLPHPR